MANGTPAKLQEMRERAEELLLEGQLDQKLVVLLERIAAEAEVHSEPAMFAHRQLAELRLEDSPWQAALHLRRIVEGGTSDDGVFALLGLCHALMSNFRSAISAYRRALGLAPRNPWYHHNLGHMLDVGIDRPEQARSHLEEAYRLEPEEDEVCASLAHCLGRLNQRQKAIELAKKAVEMAPQNAEHKLLQGWLLCGAAKGEASPLLRSQDRLAPPGAHQGPVGSHKAAPMLGDTTSAQECEDGRDPVEVLISHHMQDSGFEGFEIDTARQLWDDYQRVCFPTKVGDSVLAATVEYALAKILDRSDTQVSTAKRYGVPASSLSKRYRHMVKVLGLLPRDARYT